MRDSWDVTLASGPLNGLTNGVDNIAIRYDGSVERDASALDASYSLRVSGRGGNASYKAAAIMFTEHVTSLRQGFALHPSGAGIAAGSWLTVARNYWYDLSNRVYLLQLARLSGTQYQVRIGISDNAASFTTSAGVILPNYNGFNRLEFAWSAGAPGTMSLWLEGAAEGSPSAQVTAANGSLSVSYPCIGVLDSAGTIDASILFDRWRRKAGDARIY